jgi:hypothetical protein
VSDHAEHGPDGEPGGPPPVIDLTVAVAGPGPAWAGPVAEAEEAAREVRLLDLSLQEAAYRAALTGRDTLLHPSLLEFLR